MAQRGLVTALVGGQYGSEGKGVIAAYLASRYRFHVRTGAPNAGHTLSHNGQLWRMRSVPCGWVSPEAILVIGAGGLIDPELLRSEAAQLDAAGYRVSERLLIDRNAGLLDPIFQEVEGGTSGEAHRLIGSTGEGVGPARMARIARRTCLAPFDQFRLAGDAKAGELPGRTVDTVELLNDFIDRGEGVLLEGTQGSGLSLVHGTWPYVTSNDTNAAQLAADAGIAPQLVSDVLLVCRTFPIRVAGNSGPLPGETSWQELGLEPEHTTVTNKVRRVAHWDDAIVARSVMLNRPTRIALTFLDYLFPEARGIANWNDLSDEAKCFLDQLGEQVGVQIAFAGTGKRADGFVVCER